MVSCGRIFEWVGFCSTCGAKRKSAWLLHSREHLLSPVQDVEDPRSLQLIFGQKHNDIDCALCPTAKRACNRAWVTAKQIENWSEMPKKTLWRWLERLEKARRIQSVSDMTQIKIDDENGRGHETTLYNLNVLNQLAMVCIDNPKYLRRFWCHKNLLYQIWYKRFFRHTGQTGG